MSPEIRRYLKQEVDRLQKIRHECDIRLRLAWGIGCVKCGGPLEEIQPDCGACHDRIRSRRRRAAALAVA